MSGLFPLALVLSARWDLLAEAAKVGDVLPVGAYKLYGVPPKPQHVYVKVATGQGAKNWKYYAGKDSDKGQAALKQQDTADANVKALAPVAAAFSGDLASLNGDPNKLPDEVKAGLQIALGDDWKTAVKAALADPLALATIAAAQAANASAPPPPPKPKGGTAATAPPPVHVEPPTPSGDPPPTTQEPAPEPKGTPAGPSLVSIVPALAAPSMPLATTPTPTPQSEPPAKATPAPVAAPPPPPHEEPKVHPLTALYQSALAAVSGGAPMSPAILQQLAQVHADNPLGVPPVVGMSDKDQAHMDDLAALAAAATLPKANILKVVALGGMDAIKADPAFGGVMSAAFGTDWPKKYDTAQYNEVHGAEADALGKKIATATPFSPADLKTLADTATRLQTLPSFQDHVAQILTPAKLTLLQGMAATLKKLPAGTTIDPTSTDPKQKEANLIAAYVMRAASDPTAIGPDSLFNRMGLDVVPNQINDTAETVLKNVTPEPGKDFSPLYQAALKIATAKGVFAAPPAPPPPPPAPPPKPVEPTPSAAPPVSSYTPHPAVAALQGAIPGLDTKLLSIIHKNDLKVMPQAMDKMATQLVDGLPAKGGSSMALKVALGVQWRKKFKPILLAHMQALQTLGAPTSTASGTPTSTGGGSPATSAPSVSVPTPAPSASATLPPESTTPHEIADLIPDKALGELLKKMPLASVMVMQWVKGGGMLSAPKLAVDLAVAAAKSPADTAAAEKEHGQFWQFALKTNLADELPKLLAAAKKKWPGLGASSAPEAPAQKKPALAYAGLPAPVPVGPGEPDIDPSKLSGEQLLATVLNASGVDADTALSLSYGGLKGHLQDTIDSGAVPGVKWKDVEADLIIAGSNWKNAQAAAKTSATKATPPTPAPTFAGLPAPIPVIGGALGSGGYFGKPGYSQTPAELLATTLAVTGLAPATVASLDAPALKDLVQATLAPMNLGNEADLKSPSMMAKINGAIDTLKKAKPTPSTGAGGGAEAPLPLELQQLSQLNASEAKAKATDVISAYYAVLHHGGPTIDNTLTKILGSNWKDSVKSAMPQFLLQHQPQVLVGALLGLAGANKASTKYLSLVIGNPYPKVKKKIVALLGPDTDQVLTDLKAKMAADPTFVEKLATAPGFSSAKSGVSIFPQASQLVIPATGQAVATQAVSVAQAAATAKAMAPPPATPPVPSLVVPGALKPSVPLASPSASPAGKATASAAASMALVQSQKPQPATGIAPSTLATYDSGIPTSGFSLAAAQHQLSSASAGGVHDKFVVTDTAGHLYLAKPPKDGSPDPYRLHAGAVASKLQALIHPPGGYVPVEVREAPGPDGTTGPVSVQPLVTSLGNFAKLDPTTMTPAQKSAVMRERVLDWLVGNSDAKDDNWVVSPNGTILGIDKERAFKPFSVSGEVDELSTTYQAISVPSYNKFFGGFASGKYDLNPMDALPAIEKFESLLDDQYRETMKPYLDALAGPPTSMSPAKLDAVFAKANNRRKNLRKDFEGFFTSLLNQRGTPGAFTFPAKSDALVQTAPASLSPLVALPVTKSTVAPHAPATPGAAAATAPADPSNPTAAAGTNVPGLSPAGKPPKNDVGTPGPGQMLRTFSGTDYAYHLGLAIKPHTTKPNLVTLKAPNTSEGKANLAKLLDDLGIDAVGPIKEGAYNYIMSVPKDHLTQAAVAKFATFVSSAVSYRPVNEKVHVKAIQYEKAEPNPHIIKDLEKQTYGLSGVGVFSDGGALEGQVMRFKKHIDENGKTYYAMDAKITADVAATFPPKLTKGGGTYSFPETTWDAQKQAFVATSGGGSALDVKASTVKVGDSTVAFAKGPPAWTNSLLLRIYPEGNENPEQAMRRILEAAHPGLADTLLKPPTDKDIENKKVQRALWSIMPQIHTAFNALPASKRTNDNARALLRGDAKVYKDLFGGKSFKNQQSMDREITQNGITDQEFDSIQDVKALPSYVAPVMPGRWKKLGGGKARFLFEGIGSTQGLLGLLGGGNPGGEGGNLVGVNERSLLGFRQNSANSGSAGADLMSGSADGLNFHVATENMAKDLDHFSFCAAGYVAVVAPDELDRMDAYMHLTDTYGSTSLGEYDSSMTERFNDRLDVGTAIDVLDRQMAKEERIPGLPPSITACISASTNEVNFRKGVNKGKILRVACNNQDSRNSAIARMKDVGMEEINGIPVEDFFVVSNSTKEIYEKYVKPAGY